MVDELQLKRAALNKVAAEQIHDSSRPARESGFDDMREYQRYMQLFNIERWLGPLGNVTFDTELVPITRSEARALATLHQSGATDSVEAQSARADLEMMAPRLQAAMDAVRTGGLGCFIKTSSRSAKDNADAAGIRERTGRSLELLRRSDENAQLIALSYASMQLLQFSEARRVLEILVGSERCWHDMELALAQDTWDESLVARRWVELEPDMEFRCFVAGGRLAAVSQYRHLIHFPRLGALRSCVLDGLVAFFEGQVKARLAGLFPGDRYVLDVAVELRNADITNILAAGDPGSMTLGRWWCIEVNPFYETTDACLFSWSRERSLLEGKLDAAGSTQPPVFRIRERAANGALSLVYGKWREALAGIAGTEALPDEGGDGPDRGAPEPPATV